MRGDSNQMATAHAVVKKVLDDMSVQGRSFHIRSIFFLHLTVIQSSYIPSMEKSHQNWCCASQQRVLITETTNSNGSFQLTPLTLTRFHLIPCKCWSAWKSLDAKSRSWSSEWSGTIGNVHTNVVLMVPLTLLTKSHEVFQQGIFRIHRFTRELSLLP